MDASQKPFWKKYIASAQLDLSIAAYSKVPPSWRDTDFTPDYNKFYYIMEGEGYVMQNDRTYYPKSGELYLLPAGIRQSYGTIGDNTFGKYWCHFTASIGDFNLFQIVETPVSISVADGTAWKARFEQLIHYRNSEHLTSHIRIHSILLEMIACFIEESGRVRLNTGLNASLDKMNAVLKYIEEHLADNISVQELARIAHFHPNYFIRLFKELTGLSPIQYVNRLRLDKAKQLLTLTSLSVSAIADTIGMELAYFSRTFKEHNGLSPTEYRESLGRGG